MALGSLQWVWERPGETKSTPAITIFLQRVQIPLVKKKRMSHIPCPGTQARRQVLLRLWEPQGERTQKRCQNPGAGRAPANLASLPPTQMGNRAQWDDARDS